MTNTASPVRVLTWEPAPPAPPAPVVDVSTRAAVDSALAAKLISVADAVDALARIRWNEGRFVPACGGTETPFVYEGQRYLYCWHTTGRVHRYIHLESDMPMPDDWTPGRR